MFSLANKVGLVVGIANEQSIAWGCAKAFHDAGAELAITYHARAENRVRPLAEKLAAPIILPLEITDDAQTDAAFAAIGTQWGHLSSARMRILEALVFLTALYSAYLAIRAIRATIGESPFLFLRLLTMTEDPLPFSFIGLLGFLIPLVAISLTFDAINGEFNRRTLSRVLAQPIYRDALLFGKFLGALLSLSIALLALWLLVIGLGLLLLGLPPSTEEMMRMLGFLVATIAYGGVWLALALLFSVVFRAPATAALAALGTWLLFSLFWSIISPIITNLIAGPAEGVLGPSIAFIHTQQIVDRVSPNTLYAESTLALLNPTTRALGPVLVTLSEARSMVPAPLPVTQSFVLVWPQLTGLIAATILIVAIAYVLFQRQEIRA